MRFILALACAVLLVRGAQPDTERLSRIPARMKAHVDAATVAGVVTVVAHQGKVVSLDAVGDQDIAAKKPMRPDTNFEVMSMTKPITSGMPEMPPPGLAGLYGSSHKTLGEAVLSYSQMHLRFEPGTKWQYSNTGMATLGRIVAVVADMRGTSYPVPEGGLYSAASDLAAFCQMMLNRGAYHGGRLLAPATVDLVTTPHAFHFGLGWSVVDENMRRLTLMSPGSCGHGGAFGTYGWVDPKRQTVGVLRLQKFPNDTIPIRDQFIQLVNASLPE